MKRRSRTRAPIRPWLAGPTPVLEPPTQFAGRRPGRNVRSSGPWERCPDRRAIDHAPAQRSCHTKIGASALDDASHFPSGLTAIESIHPSCPMSCVTAPVFRS